MIKSWSGASEILFIFHHFHPLLISFPLGFEQPSMQLLNDELQCFPELSNYSNLTYFISRAVIELIRIEPPSRSFD